MNTIGYHTISNSMRTADFIDIKEILPIRVVNSDKVVMYQFELLGVVYDDGTASMETHIGMVHDDDYLEYEGKRYSFAELDRFTMVWENIQNKKALEELE